ncbi:hypothetical protein D3H59_19715 [Micromonospora endophytica]|nr:hypothetical protein D3H59_19715 [Micromonospora endophytica]
MVGAFFALAHTLPDTVDPDCQESFCGSPRDGFLIAGIFFGAPALFVALLISLVMLGLASARSPETSAGRVGFIAAVPAFVLLALAACAVAR